MRKNKVEINHGEVSRNSIKEPTIICGYQGFGMVGPLVVNHLIEEMGFQEIGSSQLREVPPVIAYRNGKMMKPMSVLYNKKHNIIVIFILAPAGGIEWEIADTIEKVAKNMDAKQVIIADGTRIESEKKVHYLSNFCDKNDCANIEKKAEPVKNAIVGGVTSALLMKDMNVLCFLGNLYQEDQEQGNAIPEMPGTGMMSPAKSAVNVIEVYNWYLKLKINTNKLVELGDKMEKEFQGFIDRLQKMKQPDSQRYIG